ncbi:GntR family transcriptional regulator [Actinopolymorpha cephalotaxi]|uniref:GntR family transcriptional regulator n=1 Tax=Actinopolymorpha cephalotaxi TaxID=504797 RepID=A0ABX2S6P2_9ACTN|nr:GntR family transcriptional regulator [Actinopolymorpha cephalotaxi]
MREALRKLRSEGLVTAERGRSPMPVQPAEIEQPLGTLYSLFASVEAAGHTQHSVVMALDIRADGVVTTRLGLEESTPLLYLARLRLADSEPLAIDRVWLPASIAAPLLEADFANTALYHELDTRCGTRLSRGHERLRAVIPTPAEQELLDMPEGTAAFAIDRLAYSVDRAVEWRQTLVRGDRFGVTSGFSARSGHLIVTGGRDTNNENGPSALLLS